MENERTAIRAKYTEEELVTCLLSAEPRQFQVIYDHFSRALLGVISQIVKDNEELAEDILQESFVKIWNTSSSYDPSRSRLFTWVLNIARNTAIDHLRSRQGKKEAQNCSLDNSVYITNSTNTAINLYEHIGLKKVIGELRPELTELINLAYFEGYTQEEIAKKLNMPLGTVKTRSRTALQQLRKTLNLD